MNILVYLVPIALGLGLIGLGAFLWSLRAGQYDDLEGASLRALSMTISSQDDSGSHFWYSRQKKSSTDGRSSSSFVRPGQATSWITRPSASFPCARY